MRWRFWRRPAPSNPALVRMERELRRMDITTREVFLSHRLDSLGYPEIAERLAITVSEVEQRVAQAISRLTQAYIGD